MTTNHSKQIASVVPSASATGGPEAKTPVEISTKEARK